jgi:hypothetical protein
VPRPRTRLPEEVLLPDPAPDGEIYVTASTAGRIVGASTRTVLSWLANGWLEESGREEDGLQQILFRYRDVIRADARARNVLAA